jgi:hypothetical protein
MEVGMLDFRRLSKGSGVLAFAFVAACGGDDTAGSGESEASTDSSSGDDSSTAPESSADSSSSEDGEPPSTSGSSEESDSGSSSSADGSSSSSDDSGSSSEDGSSGESSSTGEAVSCEPPLYAEDVIFDCNTDDGYTIQQHRAAVPGVPTAHMITLYEPLYFGHDAPVHFDLPGSNILVLHSSSPTQWVVELGDQGALDEIWLFGGVIDEEGTLASTVTAPDGVEVHDGGNPDVDYSACSGLQDALYEACIYEARRVAFGAVIGQEIDSSDGCYDGQHFEFESHVECGGTPGDSVPECAGQDGPAGVAREACTEIMTESSYCAMYNGTTLDLVGMDSGDTCVHALVDGAATPYEGGLAWIGDEVFVCDDTVWRVSLVDGVSTDSGFACRMVSDGPGGILVAQPFGEDYGYDDAVLFADFDAIVANTPTAVYPLQGLHGLHMASDGDQVYASWFAGHVAQRWDLNTGVRQPDAPFTCWDDFIGGIDVLDGTAYVIATHDDVIKRFDATTGAFLGQVEPATILAFEIGLACRTGG